MRSKVGVWIVILLFSIVTVYAAPVTISSSTTVSGAGCSNNANNDITVNNGAVVTVSCSAPGWKMKNLDVADGVITHDAEDTNGVVINSSANVTIESNGKIDVSGKGCKGGKGGDSGSNQGEDGYSAASGSCVQSDTGSGQGGTSSGDAGGGGSFGGDGLSGYPSGGSNGATYGTEDAPDTLGAGGGGAYYNASEGEINGTNGGGKVVIFVNDTFTADGPIIADGTISDGEGGAGSGGSVWISAGYVLGNGNITANGGKTDTNKINCGGSGGGGRVKVDYGNKKVPKGKKFKFNDPGDHIEIPSSPANSFNGDITLDAWIKPTQYNEFPFYGVIIQKETSYYLFFNPDGKVMMGLHVPGDWRAIISKKQLEINKWYHIVGTFQQSTKTFKIYIDDKLDNQAVETNLPSWDTSGSPVWIGSHISDSRYQFYGMIGDVNISNSVKYVETPTKIDNAQTYTFVNQGDQTIIPNSPANSFNGDITLDTWIYPTQYGTDPFFGVIIQKEASYLLHFEADGRVRFGLHVPGYWPGVVSNRHLELNRWHHITATFDQSTKTFKLYLDEVLDRYGVAASVTSWDQTSNGVWIGDHSDTRYQFFGKISNIKISNSVVEPKTVIGYDHSWAYTFTNEGDHQTVPSSNANSYNGDLSLITWIYATQYGSYPGAIIKKEGAYQLLFNQNGTINFSLHTSGGWVGTTSVSNLSLNKWYKVVGSFEQSTNTYRIVIDDRIDKQEVISTPTWDVSGNAVWIGSDQSNSQNQFYGKIDNFQTIRNRIMNSVTKEFPEVPSAVYSLDDSFYADDSIEFALPSGPIDTPDTTDFNSLNNPGKTKLKLDIPGMAKIAWLNDQPISDMLDFDKVTPNGAKQRCFNRDVNSTSGSKKLVERNDTPVKEGKDLDSGVRMGADNGGSYIEVDSSILGSTYDSSANISLYSIDCENFSIYHISSSFSSYDDLRTRGTKVADQSQGKHKGGSGTGSVLSGDVDPYATDIDCAGGLLTYTALHFQGTGGGGPGPEPPGPSGVPEFSDYALFLLLGITITGIFLIRERKI